MSYNVYDVSNSTFVQHIGSIVGILGRGEFTKEIKKIIFLILKSSGMICFMPSTIIVPENILLDIVHFLSLLS